MKKHNIPLLLALILTSLACMVNTIDGDMELLIIQPTHDIDNRQEKQEIWTMVRSGRHGISFNLFFASMPLALLHFTKIFKQPETVLRSLTIYFLSYSIVWFIVTLISPACPCYILKLEHWLLLVAISGFIYLGTKNITLKIQKP